MKLNVLELYSGIGGMHMALNDAEIESQVAAAVDINTSANTVYRHNFPSSRQLQRNIQSLSAEELDNMHVDLLTMSPPCQPFSRLGKRAGLADARTSSFLHVLQQLVRMRRTPRFLLLENVAGFERSEARTALLATLRRMRLNWREFLISPVQLGVPNSRTRYYLIARRGAFAFPAPEENEVATELPFCVCRGAPAASPCSECGRQVLEQLSRYLTRKHREVQHDMGDHSTPTLASFLSRVTPADTTSLLLADRTLARYAEILDIVAPSSRRCCCFTSGYGHLVEGAGSVLIPEATLEETDAAFLAARGVPQGDEAARAGCLRKLRLRRFAPEEVARLMCYPDCFVFPDQFTQRQRYKLLGNSVNVRTVAVLLLVLLHAPTAGVSAEQHLSGNT